MHCPSRGRTNDKFINPLTNNKRWSEGGITIGYDNPRRAKSGKSIVTRWTSYLNDRSRVTFFQFDHESIRFIYHQLTDVNLPNVRVETKGPSLVDLIALTRSIEWTN